MSASDLPVPDLPVPGPSSGATVGRDLPVPARALAIGAHPDDVEFGCGGTLAKWAAAGCVINHLVCTDGSKGTWDPDVDPAALVATRQTEQRDAAAALGSTGEVVFLGWPDGELDSSLRQRWQVSYWIRKLRPNVVLGHDPWKRYRLHPDHRHAGLLAVEGIVSARDPLFFPEQELPHHRPDALLLWEADEADHVEDVTDHVEAKLTALRAHTSQFRSTMGVDPDDPRAEAQWGVFADRIHDRLTEWGQLGGCARGEGFKLIDRL
ncbi:PIG-L deacetylase family protein [Actinospongicola halichondriae]|uniref:PIG-L deacetylase family protein n=1 Tax=Actinospongicola halichondriae TaxID=3236844 RepID=UPI003D4EEC3C